MDYEELLKLAKKKQDQIVKIYNYRKANPVNKKIVKELPVEDEIPRRKITDAMIRKSEPKIRLTSYPSPKIGAPKSKHRATFKSQPKAKTKSEDDVKLRPQQQHQPQQQLQLKPQYQTQLPSREKKKLGMEEPLEMYSQTIPVHKVSNIIKKLFGHNRYDPTPNEEECRNMESSYAFIQKEEIMSQRVARYEDKMELLRTEKLKKK